MTGLFYWNKICYINICNFQNMITIKKNLLQKGGVKYESKCTIQ